MAFRGSVVAGMVMLVASPVAANAAERFAAPDGSELTGCTSDQPCTISRAVNSAGAGDEVIIRSGDYGSSVAPLITPIASAAPGLDIHGEAGQPRPRVFLATAAQVAGVSLSGAGSKLRNLEIEVQAAGGMGSKQIALQLDNTQASQVIARNTAAEGRACVVLHASVLTDSVCHATQTFAKGVATYTGVGPGTTNSSVLRNVTAIATANAGVGIEALSALNAGEDQLLTVSNAIARGQPGQADVAVLSAGVGAMSQATITIDHSNFGFESFPPGNDRVLEGPGGGNQRTFNAGTAVQFANATDFHQLAGSPTIDAGVNAAENGPADFDGDPRSLGLGTDIGADEFVPPPTATTGDASPISVSSATLNGTINPLAVATTYHFDYGPTTSYGTMTAAMPAGTGNADVAVAESVGGLDPSTTYHFRIVATSAGGVTSGADRTFTTGTPDRDSGRLISLSLSPRRFAAAGRGESIKTAVARRKGIGTTVSLELSDAASVGFTVQRAARRKRAKRFVPVSGGFEFVGLAGANNFRFTGRIGGRKLRSGRYRLVGEAGGEVRRAAFKIVAPSPRKR